MGPKILVPGRLRLILASASARRLELLRQIGVAPVEVRTCDIDEAVRPGEMPRNAAARLAREKSNAALRSSADELVLSADTIVACGRRILPKTEELRRARAHLELLSGRRHRVYTAIVLARYGLPALERVVETRVAFKSLSAPEIDAYLASEEWRGKAGAYAIQGLAGRFVHWIEGSYSNVVGLPLFETACLLEGAGYTIDRRDG